jgi:hypothetical protein
VFVELVEVDDVVGERRPAVGQLRGSHQVACHLPGLAAGGLGCIPPMREVAACLV